MMKKLLLMLVVASMMLATVAAPALADNKSRHHDHDKHHFNDFEVVYVVPAYYAFAPLYYPAYAYDCPFWGDFEGVVNHWDCFD